MSEPEPPGDAHEAADPRDLRCSDAERELVAEALQQAATDGRLTLDEMSDRLDRTYEARTYRDLEPIVRDLPGVTVPGVPAQPTSSPGSSSSGAVVPMPGRPVVGSSTTPDSAVAVFSETKRTGVWTVPEDYAGLAVFGSVTLDLREASLASQTLRLQANAVLGEVTVIVDDSMTVRTAGTPILGEYNGPHETPQPDRPHVELTGLALLGSVEVKRKRPKRRRT
jgi:hypothetical protein